MLNPKTLKRYRADPVAFVDEVLINPATGKPYVLLEAEKEFLRHAFRLNKRGKLVHPLLIYSAIKKSGKTEFAGIFVVTLLVLFAEPYSEAFCVANDREQAETRVFEVCKRIVAACPLLKNETKVLAGQILFTTNHSKIIPVAGDYTGAAGAHPSITVFDEIWGFTSERARRLWDEFVPVPTRKISCRLIVSHAGFEAESELLRELHQRGTAQPKIGTDLYAGNGQLTFWSHTPIAPWQDAEWLDEMRRSLRPNQFLRMIENRFVSSESTFIDMAAWDACVDPNWSPVVSDHSLNVFVGIDASHKRDSTAIVVVCYDRPAKKVKLVFHRVFQPHPDNPLDFEETIANTIRVIRQRYSIKQVLFDPWQMQATSQQPAREGIKIQEFPQSPANLTAASQNLYELIQGQNLVLYPDPATRLAASRAIAIETPRGWRIAKEKQSHKIDVIVALGMAAHAAIEAQSEPPAFIITDEDLRVIAASGGRYGGGGNGPEWNHGGYGVRSGVWGAVGERAYLQMTRKRGW
jgi:hypothetical protein